MAGRIDRGFARLVVERGETDARVPCPLNALGKTNKAKETLLKLPEGSNYRIHQAGASGSFLPAIEDARFTKHPLQIKPRTNVSRVVGYLGEGNRGPQVGKDVMLWDNAISRQRVRPPHFQRVRAPQIHGPSERHQRI